MTNPRFARFSVRALVLRAMVALAVLAFALVVARDTLSNIRGPQGAGWIDAVTKPNSAVLTRQFDLVLATAKSTTLLKLPDWERSARDVLRRDPLDAGPLRILALYANERGDTRDASDLFTTANRLTRRDPVVQLWLIEQSGKAGNLSGMLKHYDQLLAVKPEISPVLFPRLTASLSDSRVRAKVAELVRVRRPWAIAFVKNASFSTVRPRDLALVFEAVDRGRPPADDLRAHEVNLIKNFADKRDYAAGLALARRVAGDDRRLLENFAFGPRKMTQDYTPFVWTLSESSGVFAHSPQDGTMRVELAPASNGLAFSRVALLEPGVYGLRSIARPVEGYSLPAGRWEVSCVAPKTPVVLATMALAPVGNGLSAQGTFSVDPKCPAIRIAFLAEAGAIQADSAIDLADISLRRS